MQRQEILEQLDRLARRLEMLEAPQRATFASEVADLRRQLIDEVADAADELHATFAYMDLARQVSRQECGRMTVAS